MKNKSHYLVFLSYIHKSESFCLTYDIWMETMQNKSFLQITINFLDNLELLSRTLGVLDLSERHTADYLERELSQHLKDWKVSTQKVSTCTGNDSTIIKLNKSLFGEKKIIPCFAHTLNLIVTLSIDNCPDVTALVNTVRDIAKFVKKLKVLMLVTYYENYRLIQCVQKIL